MSAADLVLQLIALAALLAAGWLWFDSLRVREAAVEAARRACRGDGVLLLDDTVALSAMRLTRNATGAIAVMRAYHFEFSDNGNNRLGGSVSLVGAAVQTVYLEPHTAAAEPVRLID